MLCEAWKIGYLLTERGANIACNRGQSGHALVTLLSYHLHTAWSIASARGDYIRLYLCVCIFVYILL